MNKMTTNELLAVRRQVESLYPHGPDDDFVVHLSSGHRLHKTLAMDLTMMEMVEKMVLANLQQELTDILRLHTSAPEEISSGRCPKCGNLTRWGDAFAESHATGCTLMAELRRQRPLKAAIMDLVAESKT